MRRLIASIVPILAFATLAGCGQKGPLVRPTRAPSPTAQPAQPVPAPNVPTPSSPDMNTLPIPDSGSGR